MNYGYIRVSTAGQFKNNELGNQRKKILSLYPDSKIYEEKFLEYSLDRPILYELMSILEKGDILIVTELSRLSSTISESIDLIKKLLEMEVNVHILNMGLIDDTDKGRFILKSILVFKDLEKVMIVERTQKGKLLAKQKGGFKEGRPRKYSRDKVEKALDMLRVNGGEHSYEKTADITGISKSTLIRRQKERLYKNK